MIDVPAIQELYRYNGWANGRMFEAVSNLTPEGVSRDLGSSYPSARDTLLHIVWAEWIWLQRWKGFSPQSVWQAADYPDLDALGTRWSDVKIEQGAFLDAISVERLRAVVRYLSLKGETWQYPLWRTMYHVLNHSSYHRGQVTTMLRQLGARALPTDFLVFHDELESPPG